MTSSHGIPPADPIVGLTKGLEIEELEDFDLDHCPRLDPDLLFIEGEGVCRTWGGSRGTVATLDAFEATLARFCDGTLTGHELAADTAAALDVDQAEAARIVSAVLRRLDRLGFLVSTSVDVAPQSLPPESVGQDLPSFDEEGSARVRARRMGVFAGQELYDLVLPTTSCAGARVLMSEALETIAVQAATGPVLIRTNLRHVLDAVSDHCATLEAAPYPVALHAIAGGPSTGLRQFSLLADCLGRTLARCWTMSELTDAVAQYVGFDRTVGQGTASVVRVRMLTRGPRTVGIAERLFRASPGTELALRRAGWTVGAIPTSVLDLDCPAFTVPRWRDETEGGRLRPSVILTSGGAHPGAKDSAGDEVIRWLAERTVPSSADSRRAAYEALEELTKDCVLRPVTRDRHAILAALADLY